MLPSCFLAVDPGTLSCGWALFVKDKPVRWGVICQEGAPGNRLMNIAARLESHFLESDCQAWVVERPAGHRAAVLETLFSHLKAKAAMRNEPFHWYWPAVIEASVRPRGTRGWGSKRVRRAGVEMLYPDLGELEQDAVDAICAGHCHLSKQAEKALLGDCP